MTVFPPIFLFISSPNILSKNCKFLFIKVPETDDEKSDYHEFCKLLINGQRIANDTKKSYVFLWKGYKACISSQLPKLSSHEMERRFKLAMDSIRKMEKEKVFRSNF